MLCSSSSPIRVIIADDHEVFRDGFNAMLEKQPDIELVGQAENGQALVDLAIKLQPDVIVMDIKMPKLDGIEATKLLMKKVPHVQVLALSMFGDEYVVVSMLEAGAKGYLLKNAHKSEIIEAIKTVHHNQTYFCYHTSHKLAWLIGKSKFNPYGRHPKAGFSGKEIEIIRLICDENSNKEMADKLYLSIRTIEGYREKILEKMEVKNTAGIVVYAIKHGIYNV